MLSSAQSSQAQSNDQIVSDYVFLIDTSGSMNDGSPTLFEQVKKVASDFVEKLPHGSNLSIFTFDSTIEKLGSWQSINAASKDTIRQQIGALKANGNYTALWDAVCAGLDEMEAMNDPDNTHIQLLISYTDGKDNFSKTPASSCLEKYQLLQKNGYTYWIFNALAGVEVPAELLALQDILGINRSNNPSPIRIAQYQPLSLKLGNLLEKDKPVQQGCLVFWLSDPSIEGKVISFSEKPSANPDLPQGTAAQVCAGGTSCEREVKVSINRVCFDFELVNLNPSTLETEAEGEYSLSLPLSIASDDELGPIYLLPQNLDVLFKLQKQEEPTQQPTDTLEPTATATVQPSSTPEPTTTPISPMASIRCQGKPEIDLGSHKTGENGVIKAEQKCVLEFEEGEGYSPISVSIETEDHSLLPYLTLELAGKKGKSLLINPGDNSFSVLLIVPSDVVSELKGGTHRFSGELKFVSHGVDLVGDFKQGRSELPLRFEITKPKSKLPLYIAGGIIGLMIIIALISKAIKGSKPPVFNLVMRWSSPGGQKSQGLMNLVPSKITGNKYSIVIGSSPLAHYQVPDLPDTAFEIIGIKTKDSMEYFIQPKTNIQSFGKTTTEEFKLNAQEPFKVGETTISFLIGS